jgi:hypothetical protein
MSERRFNRKGSQLRRGTDELTHTAGGLCYRLSLQVKRRSYVGEHRASADGFKVSWRQACIASDVRQEVQFGR